MSLWGLFTAAFAGMWWCEGKVGFSVDTEPTSPAGHWLSCVCVQACAGRGGRGGGSSKCVNPFFLVAVPGPPSCFSPHIITILFLPHPLVTRPCTHSPSNPLVRLQRTSRFYEQSGHTRTRAQGCTPPFEAADILQDVTFRGQQSFT